MMNRKVVFGTVFAAVAICGYAEDVAALLPEPPAGMQDSEVQDANVRDSEKKPRPDLSESELNLTMAFASENHAELARLLEHLRKSRPKEFQRAARELHQQMQSLDKLRERNPVRYSNQLELWKVDSQIRVLVAKWSRSRDDALEQEIRMLLRQRNDTRLAQLRADRQRLTEQLQKAEKQIAALSAAPDLQIDREWDQLSKKTSSNQRNDKSKSSNKNNSN